MIWTIILAFIVIVLIQEYLRRWSRRGRLIEKMPGPTPLPILGNLLSFQGPTEALWNMLRDMNEKYYPIYRIWSFLTPVVNIRHPDDVEVILSSPKYIEKSIIYSLLEPWFATGLLTSTGAKWQNRRKILTPAFHFNVLQQFVDIFVEEAERTVETIKSSNRPVVLDLLPLMSKITLNAICETAMGTVLSSKGTFQHKYRDAIYRMGEILLYKLVRPWLHNPYLFALFSKSREQTKLLKILHGFTRKIIDERKLYHERTNGQYLKQFTDNTGYDTPTADDDIVMGIRKRRMAMLDLLIAAQRNGNQIDNDGIREEVDTFMFEGHDTTAMALCFFIMLLAEHKEIQERVRQEVTIVMQENNGKMNMAILQQLPYLERCIKESLRLYPSVHFISRNVSEDMHLKKYIIPEGTVAHIHIYDIHRDPNFWTDPLVYDPDRFLPEKIQGRHPYSYVPFSAGPRNCIGQRFAMTEMKAFMSYILYNFYLEPIDFLKDLVIHPDLVLRPNHPIRVKFVPINHSSPQSSN